MSRNTSSNIGNETPHRQETVVRTFQLRLRDRQPVLDDVAMQFQAAKRALYAEARMRDVPFRSLKKEFCARYRLPGRLFNSLAISLTGMVASVQEKSKLDLLAVIDRRAEAEAKLRQLVARRDAPPGKGGRPLSSGDKTELRHKIENLRRRLGRLGGKITCLQRQIDADYPSICFGGRKRFNAQHLPEHRGDKGHAKWLEAWRDARSDEFQVVGSDDEDSGNATCRATVETDGSISLSLALLGERYGQRHEIRSLRLRHGHDEIVRAIEMATLECRRAKAWQKQTAALKHDLGDDEIKAVGAARKQAREAQHKLGFAISYRFKRDARSWRVFITITEPVAQVEASFENGAIGIDHNADHFAVVLVNADGSLRETKRIPAVLAGLSSGQRAAIVKDVAHYLVTKAKELSVPLVIEDLDFTNKKRRLKEIGSARAARMLSSFGYSAFRSALVACAKRRGVAVVTVNPAWTSVIGAACHAVDNGISVHLAAAFVIARRAMGWVEAVPSAPRFAAGHERPFVLSTPIDLRSKASERDRTGSAIPGQRAWSWIATAQKAERVARLKRKPTGAQRREILAIARDLDKWRRAA